jgi:hypothetical protein
LPRIVKGARAFRYRKVYDTGKITGNPVLPEKTTLSNEKQQGGSWYFGELRGLM